MERATSSAAWRRAYEAAFADARKLPIVVRLTPLTLLYVMYKQLRYLPAVSTGRNG